MYMYMHGSELRTVLLVEVDQLVPGQLLHASKLVLHLLNCFIILRLLEIQIQIPCLQVAPLLARLMPP